MKIFLRGILGISSIRIRLRENESKNRLVVKAFMRPERNGKRKDASKNKK